MGVVTVSSSASRTPLGLSATFSSYRSPSERPLILAFKTVKTKNNALVAPAELVSIPAETPKENKKKLRRSRKASERLKALSIDEVPSCTFEVDYNEAAAKLESLYKLSPTSHPSDVDDTDHVVRRGGRRRTKEVGDEEYKIGSNVVRSGRKFPIRLNLAGRISLRNKNDCEMACSVRRRKDPKNEEDRIRKLIREYSVSSELVSYDWKKMKIPPVLPSSEHSFLFKLMQPMKEILEVKGNLEQDLGQEPRNGDLAEAMKMTVVQLRKTLVVGQAARNKLVKHNLRLVLFVVKKYFREFANGPEFSDLCQAGVNGLITAIDRFEPKRKFRLSTYGLFWIRHAIIRSLTVSSFLHVPFGLESVRVEIQRAKLELSFELNRLPTEEEIIKKVGISPSRYHEVMRASKPVSSLNAKHRTTQQELIDGLADTEGVGGDERQPALLRLALDDVKGRLTWGRPTRSYQ
ncbi:RNA polymerase sigma factor sigE, chloroplastic/mitochondrial isoform X2 [Rhododendron vialii]|uniref:RNA polymerase sigma factor sigE, chloroplastic/mitochondrial isoform X2 n=1 Tax=Rhododendron vialii TaxID=182163 RepID=UPI00265FE480|nr:RNA polymerase sigma factor sigE, chloroplastic/mitochondrial isoform X2 [Rhododendron vialii]